MTPAASSILSGMLAAGCLWSASAVAGELNLLNWADYTAPEVVTRFEQETGHKVTVTTFTSYDEMRALLDQDSTRYDVVVPSEYHIHALIGAGLLEKVAAYRLPGFENIEENWRGQSYDPGNDYSVPWHWGTTAFVVDTTRFQGDADTLKAVFEPAPGTRIGVLDDGDEVITMALRYLGLPRCNDQPADLAKVEALLRDRAGLMDLFDAEHPVDWLVNTTVPVAMAWNGDALRARKQRPGLRYAYPREGVTVWTDTLAVPKGARHKAEALEFMVFMLRPENAALQSNYTGYANAIHGSEQLLTPDLQASPEIIIPPRAKLEFLQACGEVLYGRYRALWSKVKPAPTGN
jgi:spermidine/putrescine transport system substrate-binding protein